MHNLKLYSFLYKTSQHSLWESSSNRTIHLHHHLPSLSLSLSLYIYIYIYMLLTSQININMKNQASCLWLWWSVMRRAPLYRVWVLTWPVSLPIIVFNYDNMAFLPHLFQLYSLETRAYFSFGACQKPIYLSGGGGRELTSWEGRLVGTCLSPIAFHLLIYLSWYF